MNLMKLQADFIKQTERKGFKSCCYINDGILISDNSARVFYIPECYRAIDLNSPALQRSYSNILSNVINKRYELDIRRFIYSGKQRTIEREKKKITLIQLEAWDGDPHGNNILFVDEKLLEPFGDFDFIDFKTDGKKRNPIWLYGAEDDTFLGVVMPFNVKEEQ